MKIVISEGTSQADFLIRLFNKKKHKLIVINSDKRTCNYLKNNFDIPIYYGDPTKKYALDEANILDADLFISLSEKDDINYVSCQLAKKLFHVERTISSVSNPKDVEVFEQLGIDSAISSTYLVAKLIEKESLSNDIYQLLNIDNDNVSLSKIPLSKNSKMLNQSLQEVKLPKHINISCILRDNDIIIPSGETKLLENDVLYVVTKSEMLNVLNKIFASNKD